MERIPEFPRSVRCHAYKYVLQCTFFPQSLPGQPQEMNALPTEQETLTQNSLNGSSSRSLSSFGVSSYRGALLTCGDFVGGAGIFHGCTGLPYLAAFSPEAHSGVTGDGIPGADWL